MVVEIEKGKIAEQAYMQKEPAKESNEEIVQVLRVVLYEGPRSLVEKQIAQSLHGTRLGMTGVSKTGVKITAVSLNEFPQVLEKARGEVKPAFGSDAGNREGEYGYNAQVNTPQSMAEIHRAIERDLENDRKRSGKITTPATDIVSPGWHDKEETKQTTGRADSDDPQDPSDAKV